MRIWSMVICIFCVGTVGISCFFFWVSSENQKNTIILQQMQAKSAYEADQAKVYEENQRRRALVEKKYADVQTSLQEDLQLKKSQMEEKYRKLEVNGELSHKDSLNKITELAQLELNRPKAGISTNDPETKLVFGTIKDETNNYEQMLKDSAERLKTILWIHLLVAIFFILAEVGLLIVIKNPPSKRTSGS